MFSLSSSFVEVDSQKPLGLGAGEKFLPFATAMIVVKLPVVVPGPGPGSGRLVGRQADTTVKIDISSH